MLRVLSQYSPSAISCCHKFSFIIDSPLLVIRLELHFFSPHIEEYTRCAFFMGTLYRILYAHLLCVFKYLYPILHFPPLFFIIIHLLFSYYCGNVKLKVQRRDPIETKQSTFVIFVVFLYCQNSKK